MSSARVQFLVMKMCMMSSWEKVGARKKNKIKLSVRWSQRWKKMHGWKYYTHGLKSVRVKRNLGHTLKSWVSEIRELAGGRCSQLLPGVQLFETPWNVACQAPLSMDFLQARILEQVAIPSSRGSAQPRDQTQVFCIAGRFFTVWATREPHEYWNGQPTPSSGDLPKPEIKPGR